MLVTTAAVPPPVVRPRENERREKEARSLLKPLGVRAAAKPLELCGGVRVLGLWGAVGLSRQAGPPRLLRPDMLLRPECRRSPNDLNELWEGGREEGASRAAAVTDSQHRQPPATAVVACCAAKFLRSEAGKLSSNLAILEPFSKPACVWAITTGHDLRCAQPEMHALVTNLSACIAYLRRGADLSHFALLRFMGELLPICRAGRPGRSNSHAAACTGGSSADMSPACCCCSEAVQLSGTSSAAAASLLTD